MLNRRAIWAIVILMGTALIGIMLIQAYWINWSVQLNKEKFDKDVYEALNQVSERLIRREQDQALEAIKNRGEDSPVYQMVEDSVGFPPALSRDMAMSSSKSFLEAPFIYLANRPFAERLDLKAIDAYLSQELRNRGIDIDYNYGVISHATKGYVIRDGHFVFDESLTEVSNTGITRELDNTSYRVDLFKDPDKLVAPGSLQIYFPQVGRQVWESVWQMLAGSFIFTLLILFCFAYTIQIIFRQKKLSEMKTDFINNMTHEFKTPIATISLASDSITNPAILSNPEKVTRFIGIIKQENSRMLNQVEKVLQMALIDKREINLNITKIDMHQIIRQAGEHITLQLEPKGGHITYDLKADPHVINGDVTHISNVIHNLLDNANKYTPEEPIIHISTKNKSDGIEVCIKDNGIGMSREQVKHIYDRFYRVHTGNVHNVKGFGLGLTYVKSMMTAHKGSVEVQSEPGKGSSFYLYFPFG